jgi:glycosyltransferase involved in cell wall biosynthesis
MNKLRAVVVIAPAWHSCGSYEVFKGQLRTLSELGYKTFFLAVSPSLGISSRARNFWRHYYQMTHDARPDMRSHTGPYTIPFYRPDFWRALKRARVRTYSHWRTLPSQLAPVPANLRRFISDHETTAILCNHYFHMPLAEKVKALAPAARIVLETHDVQSRHHVAWRRTNPLNRRGHDFEELFADELAFVAKADTLVHLNEDEMKLFAERLPRHRHLLVFPTTRSRYRRREQNRPWDRTFDFLIIASANYGNYRNVSWFLEEVWSSVLDRRFTLKIVGSVDSEFSSRRDPLYERHRSLFTGRVEDLDDFYAKCRVVLLPVIEGNGIAIKTIEALAFGKPVIATPLAFRGFEMRLPEGFPPGLARDAQEFRAAIIAAGEGDYPVKDWRGIHVYEHLFSPEAYRLKYSDILTA